jgi:16S rRNA (guanine527-N7)-methyltransferase
VLDEAGARPPEFFAAEIEKQSPPFGLTFQRPAAAKLALYLAVLDHWRRRTNLTGPLPPEALVTHALESVLGDGLIAHGTRVLDIGSGAGMPGIPLSITRTDLFVALLEPRRKRAAFLRHVIREVPVENAEVLEERVERLARPVFDVATVRAVGNLEKTLGKADFLREKGRLLVWTTEAQAVAQSLSGVFVLHMTVPVPGARRRCLALLEKR